MTDDTCQGCGTLCGHATPASSCLRPKLYPLLEDAVESGVLYGMRRAYKHTDKPSQEDVAQAVLTAVLAELCERFHVGDE